ncbi:putative ribonuclease H-like domain-containing protein, partial [Tanacetum coccineum]
YGPKISKSVSENVSNEVRKSLGAPLVEELVSDVDKFEKKTVFPTRIEFVKQQEKPDRKPVNFDHLQTNCNYHQRERVVYGSNYTRVNYNYSAQKAHPSAQRNMVPRAVLMKNGLRTLNTAWPVNTIPKLQFIVLDQWNMSYLLDFKEFDRGYVTFGGGAKGGRITGKGTLKTGTLDFEDVYFVKELQFTWVFFLASKDETSDILKSFITQIKNLVDKKVKIIRCYNGTEFKNRVMSEFCEKKGIKREFSVARTPQQNGVAERRNMTLIEAARTIKAFRVYNIRTRKVEENLHVRFLEDKPIIAGVGPKWLFDIYVQKKALVQVTLNASNDEPQPSNDIGKKNDDSEINNQERPEKSAQDVNTVGPCINTDSTNDNTDSLNINTGTPIVNTTPLEDTHDDFFGDETEVDMSNISTTYLISSTPNTRIHKDHSLAQVIGDIQSSVQTRRMINEQGFISVVYEGKTHEDLHNCLFACFLSQEEPKKMDVKSSFLYGKIEEEVYVCQPPGFEDLEFPDKVYKVEKALYGLHQAPRACYETLSTYLLDNGFQRGQIDKTLFIKRIKASTPMETSKSLLKDAEAEDVDVHLYRSMIGSLMYLTTSKPDIMFDVCACARFQVTPKGSYLHAVKRIFRYLKGQPKLGLWYSKDSSFDLEAYTDSDYAGASLDRKSTIGGCQFLGSRLILWQCMKQTIVATSTTEAEYVATASCCSRSRVAKIPWGGAEAQTRFEAASKQSNDPPLSRASAKAKIVNGQQQIQALIDKKKVIITKTSIRSNLKLDDAEGIDCLPTATIFAELERMRDQEKVFSRRGSHLYLPTMMIQASDDIGEDSADPSNSIPHLLFPNVHHLNLKKKKVKGGNKRKDIVLQSWSLMRLIYYTLHMHPPQSGEDSMQLSELMNYVPATRRKSLI